MKKIVLVLCMLFTVLFASTTLADTEQVQVLLNKSLGIRYNDVYKKFQDAKGTRVYPLSYQGTTYLPIRAISSLFEEGITWKGESNSIFLGKGDVDKTSCQDDLVHYYSGTEYIDVIINRDIKIYYKDRIQTFKDANGKVVYPISYKGTTYLPVRAISNLFGAEISYEQFLGIVDISKK